ncbi:hypothetical protein QUB42_26465 [Microcoleus sp. Aus8_D1]|uniref:hypothetical protein n=1 Tax=Microcoleus sp. Aus8_D2 TaxID=2818632 RepID=UPI002FD48BD4
MRNDTLRLFGRALRFAKLPESIFMVTLAIAVLQANWTEYLKGVGLGNISRIFYTLLILLSHFQLKMTGEPS